MQGFLDAALPMICRVRPNEAAAALGGQSPLYGAARQLTLLSASSSWPSASAWWPRAVPPAAQLRSVSPAVLSAGALATVLSLSFVWLCAEEAGATWQT